MPTKYDPATGKRWVEMEIAALAAPHELWRLMATGAGVTAWFTHTDIEERVGGRLHFDFGAMGNSSGEVTAWEPPYRFGYVERDWDEGAPPVSTDITISPRRDGTCVVRLVHSLSTTDDDWDAALEGFEAGWPAFFEILKLYLAHYAGEPAAFASVVRQSQDEQASLWRRLLGALQISHADVGEHAVLPFASPEGLVECVRQNARQRYLILRAPMPDPEIIMLGTFSCGGLANASITHYCYGRDAAARAQASRRHWQDWFDRHMPAA